MLRAQAQNWPTPNSTDGTKAPKMFAGKNPSLPTASKSFPDTLQPETTTGLGLLLRIWIRPECPRLNANFAEWLMGWPVGLTASVLSETEWTRWLQLTHLSLCGLVSENQNKETQNETQIETETNAETQTETETRSSRDS